MVDIDPVTEQNLAIIRATYATVPEMEVDLTLVPWEAILRKRFVSEGRKRYIRFCIDDWARRPPPKPTRPPVNRIELAKSCAHDHLSAECEGWEAPTEPLSIRVTCGDCWSYIDVVVEDPDLQDWNPPD